MMRTLRMRALLLVVILWSSSVFAQDQKPKPAARPNAQDIEKINAALPDKAPATPKQPRKLLIYTKATGFVHSSIPVGAKAFELMGQKTGAFTTVISDDPAARSAEITLAGADEAGGADEQPLDEPVVEVFRVGAMALSWDADAERVVIEAQPQDDSGDFVEADDQDDDGPDLMRVHLQPDEAREFVRRANLLMAAGRPPCPFCGQPLEPTGHFCLALNGQRN